MTANATSYPGADAAEPPVRVERAYHVTTLTLNRPAQFNALSDGLLDALRGALASVAADGDVRCVVLAGSGRAFCAGHDLKEMRDANGGEDHFRALFAHCSEVMRAIRALPVPVVAKVHGVATAAGCQLVAACDLAVAAKSARFAVSGIDVGLFCATPAVALSRNVPAKAAFDMLFTGRFIPAEQALAFGLVNAVVEDHGLDGAVADYAREICRKSPAAVRLGKEMFYAQAAMGLDEAYRYAGETMARNMTFDDAREGIAAFVAKRPTVGRPG